MQQTRANLPVSSAQRTVIALKGQEIFVQKGDLPAVPLLSGKRFSVEISDDARCHIAFKIARLLPDLQDREKSDLLSYTVRVLELLCKDQLTRVREILAEELKNTPLAPHDVVMSLAKDEAISVSCPVLECSPLLTDHDLVEIIKSSGKLEVLQAIAKRKRLSSLVTDTILACKQLPVIRTLLGNHGAEYSPHGYDLSAEMAINAEELHEPLLRLPELPQRIINRIASYVSQTLVERLAKEGVLPSKMAEDILSHIKERLENLSENQKRQASAQVKELAQKGELNTDAMEEAILAGNRAFVKAALAEMSGFTPNKVERILNSDNARAITSLCWKAGLSMRYALQIQMRIGRIHHTKLVNAKHGTAYPMADQEMLSYLEFFAD